MEYKMEWYGKPYYSLDAWCKNTLARKCYKIALNAHMTCPNRDGSLGSRGCIFCSAGGSGDFAVDIAGKSVEQQLEEGLSRFHNKFPVTPITRDASGQSTQDNAPCLIAYFQAYTNTYAPLSYLRQVYTQALDCPWVCGISIATRPDCLPGETLSLLAQLKETYPDKFIWVELGLQTIHEETANFLRRGYELPVFETAFEELTGLNIPVIVHLIIGLPGENKEMLLQSISYINQKKPFGVKLQLLHILRDTDLGELYLNNPDEITALSKESYLDLLISCIRHLSPEIVIHRLTGDGPRETLLAPVWSLNKRDVLNSIHKALKEQSARQGDCIESNIESNI